MQFYWNGKLEFNLSIYLSPSEQTTWSKYWSTTSPQSINLHFALPQRARLKLSCTAALPRNLEEHTPGSDFGKDFPVTWRSPKDSLKQKQTHNSQAHRSRTTFFLRISLSQFGSFFVEAASSLIRCRWRWKLLESWTTAAIPSNPVLTSVSSSTAARSALCNGFAQQLCTLLWLFEFTCIVHSICLRADRRVEQIQLLGLLAPCFARTLKKLLQMRGPASHRLRLLL